MTKPRTEDGVRDEWARDLLHEAAATIDVLPGAPLVPERHRPRWPLVVAAAAVAGIVVGVPLLGRVGSDPQPASPPPTADRAAVVPSVFGLTTDQARGRLEASGLSVTDRPRAVCETPDQALGTIPVAGEPVPGSGEVTLSYPDPRADVDCPQSTELRAEAWDFLGFLAGQRPAPGFAPTVTITRGAGLAPVILNGARTQDPTQWGALSEVLDAMTASDATMTVDSGAPSGDPSCTRPPVGYGARPLDITIGHYLDATPGACGVRLVVNRTRGGVIDGVTLLPSNVIVTMEPGTGRLPLALSNAGVPRALASTAEAFADFARVEASPAPPLAARVALYVDGAPLATVDGTELTDRDAWFGCSGDCGPSLLAPLRRAGDGDVQLELTTSVNPILCIDATTDPMPASTRSLRRVVVEPISAQPCSSDFRYELYVDSAGDIAAVNLVQQAP